MREEADPYKRPTKHNMRMDLYWLMQGCQPGDSLVFHFSGHGSQQRNYTGDEALSKITSTGAMTYAFIQAIECGHGNTYGHILGLQFVTQAVIGMLLTGGSAGGLRQTPMSMEDAHKLLTKFVGWRLLDEEGGLKLQYLWKLRDFKCGVALVNRIYNVTEATGHFPNLHLEQSNQVRAELWTSSIGGLSMNDFIVAAKIDEMRTSDLVPRKRVWA
ncbi:hypothetical protein Ddye_026599 [Dipteronia dyeriana]|uniref:4a-hydroxytetrahydrobiopterin dehydratase n=1 Tax=Dipteronia dyeriana TaxID=168575 RepID=A0AAD9WPD1_9ROSI|nr:hypothetical protein Ddye_026599 [Dipteronia dyeriana]